MIHLAYWNTRLRTRHQRFWCKEINFNQTI